jgi:cytochrome P450
MFHLNFTFPELVWIDAIVNETLRLHTIAPVGLPHRITDDLQLGNWTIPKNVRHKLSSTRRSAFSKI